MALIPENPAPMALLPATPEPALPPVSTCVDILPAPPNPRAGRGEAGWAPKGEATNAAADDAKGLPPAVAGAPKGLPPLGGAALPPAAAEELKEVFRVGLRVKFRV